MRRLAWLVLLLSVGGTAAIAGPLPAPRIVPGRHVYTIPAGFDPPMIGQPGLKQIEQSARKLHFPYYVVIVESLPASLLDSVGGDGDAAAARALDGLAADWQSQSGFDVGKSSIFLLCYNPRKYRFLAGATWKTKLGFEKDAHAPYTAIFEQYIQGTPKDPQTGIIEMMKAVDFYLFDQTDPARIKARQEAAIKAEQQRMMQEAQGSLDNQIARRERLLKSPHGYLPKDVRNYRVALDRARKVRLGTDTQLMLSEAEALDTSNNTLNQYIEQKTAEAVHRKMVHDTKVAGLVLGVVFIALWFFLRLASLLGLRRTFAAAAKEWDTKLLNAKGKYADFYGTERESVIGLAEMTGETKALFGKVTNEVDAIYLGVEAMDAHLAQCRNTASRGSFFLTSPIRKAAKDLNSEFEFDTGQLDSRNLFGPPTKILQVRPAEFFRELEDRYARTVDKWNELKEAAKIRLQTAEELFAENKLDTMLALADQYSVPHAWLSDHPLFGSDEEDEVLYGGVNANRKTDPVAFAIRVDELGQTERHCEERLNRLVEAVKMVKSSRLDSPPTVGTTVLAPQDDPRLIFESARHEEDRFAGLLAGKSADRAVDEVVVQAQTVQKLYQTCAEQAAAVQSAISDAAKTIEQTAGAMASADAMATKAASRLEQAEKIHSNVGGAQSSLDSGRQFLADAERVLESARAKLADNRHLEARKEAWQASEQFSRAASGFDQCVAACDKLDQQKAVYESKLAEMGEARQRAERRMRGYGGSGRLGEVPNPVIAGPIDYLLLLATLERLEQDWDVQIRNAQRAYEREQARIRMQQETERRQNSSSSGFPWGGGSSSGGGWGGGSSSSGGSWGGSDSSSSGGSWGGGGGSDSSSSGGSW